MSNREELQVLRMCWYVHFVITDGRPSWPLFLFIYLFIYLFIFYFILFYFILLLPVSLIDMWGARHVLFSRYIR